MSAAKIDGADWLMGSPRKVAARDIDQVVQWMEVGAAGVATLSKELEAVARAAVAVLSSGLSHKAVALLVQDLLPKTRRGNATVSLKTVHEVLTAAANLRVHLRPKGGAK